MATYAWHLNLAAFIIIIPEIPFVCRLLLVLFTLPQIIPIRLFHYLEAQRFVYYPWIPSAILNMHSHHAPSLSSTYSLHAYALAAAYIYGGRIIFSFYLFIISLFFSLLPYSPL